MSTDASLGGGTGERDGGPGELRVTTRAAEETERLGQRLAESAPEPITVGISGALGAGKTQFARGFVRGIAAELAEWVTSPTYAICNTYPASPPVHHFDLYRLEDADDLEGVGYRESDDGWRFVEWIDRIPEAVESADVLIEARRGSGDEREYVFRGATGVGRATVAALAGALS